MRLLFGGLVLMTGRQLRHLIGAAIQPSTRSPENVDGQEGRSHAVLLAVSTSRFSHAPVSQSAVIAVLTFTTYVSGGMRSDRLLPGQVGRNWEKARRERPQQAGSGRGFRCSSGRPY
jgi:hypothetical protein